jgi:hypothetical protein
LKALDFSAAEAKALAAALPGSALAADCELAIAGKLPLARLTGLQAAIEAFRKVAK